MSSPHKAAWDVRVQQYARDFPEAYVVDLPAAVSQLANRSTMLNAVHEVKDTVELATVRAPRQIVATPGTEAELRAQMEGAGLQLPLLAKSLLADGSSDSHKVAIIHDLDGLASVCRGDVTSLRPPCIMQEYVNHGGYLFKVYVVGDTVTMTRRKSLPDLRGAWRGQNRRRKPGRKGSRAGMGEGGRGGEGTADVDGDVSSGGGSSGEDTPSDEDDNGWYATGLQSIPRVSCFKGGPTDSETSWRDRAGGVGDNHAALQEVMERMQRSGEGSSTAVEAEDAPQTPPSLMKDAGRDAANVHYLTPSNLASHLAKNLTNLTVSRIGSVDSISDDHDPSASSDGGTPSTSVRGDDSDGNGALPMRQFSGLKPSRYSASRTGLPPLPPGQRHRQTHSDGIEAPENVRVMKHLNPDYSPEPSPNSQRVAEVAAPSEDFVRQLALALRDKLRLRLFNFDLIRVTGSNDEFLVVDINYFPGIAKMPGYSDAFCHFLKSAKGKNSSQL